MRSVGCKKRYSCWKGGGGWAAVILVCITAWLAHSNGAWGQLAGYPKNDSDKMSSNSETEKEARATILTDQTIPVSSGTTEQGKGGGGNPPRDESSKGQQNSQGGSNKKDGDGGGTGTSQKKNSEKEKEDDEKDKKMAEGEDGGDGRDPNSNKKRSRQSEGGEGAGGAAKGDGKAGKGRGEENKAGNGSKSTDEVAWHHGFVVRRETEREVDDPKAIVMTRKGEMLDFPLQQSENKLHANTPVRFTINADGLIDSIYPKIIGEMHQGRSLLAEDYLEAKIIAYDGLPNNRRTGKQEYRGVAEFTTLKEHLQWKTIRFYNTNLKPNFDPEQFPIGTQVRLVMGIRSIGNAQLLAQEMPLVIDVVRDPASLIHDMKLMLSPPACHAFWSHPAINAEVFFGEEIRESRVTYLELRASLSTGLPDKPDQAFKYLYEKAIDNYKRRADEAQGDRIEVDRLLGLRQQLRKGARNTLTTYLNPYNLEKKPKGYWVRAVEAERRRNESQAGRILVLALVDANSSTKNEGWKYINSFMWLFNEATQRTMAAVVHFSKHQMHFLMWDKENQTTTNESSETHHKFCLIEFGESYSEQIGEFVSFDLEGEGEDGEAHYDRLHGMGEAGNDERKLRGEDGYISSGGVKDPGEWEKALLIAHNKKHLQTYPLQRMYGDRIKKGNRDPHNPDVISRYFPNINDAMIATNRNRLHLQTEAYDVENKPISIPHSFIATRFYYPVENQITIILSKSGLPPQSDIAQLAQDGLVPSFPIYSDENVLRIDGLEGPRKEIFLLGMKEANRIAEEKGEAAIYLGWFEKVTEIHRLTRPKRLPEQNRTGCDHVFIQGIPPTLHRDIIEIALRALGIKDPKSASARFVRGAADRHTQIRVFLSESAGFKKLRKLIYDPNTGTVSEATDVTYQGIVFGPGAPPQGNIEEDSPVFGPVLGEGESGMGEPEPEGVDIEEWSEKHKGEMKIHRILAGLPKLVVSEDGKVSREKVRPADPQKQNSPKNAPKTSILQTEQKAGAKKPKKGGGKGAGANSNNGKNASNKETSKKRTVGEPTQGKEPHNFFKKGAGGNGRGTGHSNSSSSSSSSNNSSNSSSNNTHPPLHQAKKSRTTGIMSESSDSEGLSEGGERATRVAEQALDSDDNTRKKGARKSNRRRRDHDLDEEREQPGPDSEGRA